MHQPRRGRAGTSSSPDDLHTPVAESPRSISRQAKLQRLLKQLHGQSTLPDEMKLHAQIGPELRKTSSTGAVSTGLSPAPAPALSSSAHEANTLPSTERSHSPGHSEGGRKTKKTVRVNVKAAHELKQPVELPSEAEPSARGRGHDRRGRDGGHTAPSTHGGKCKSPRCGRHR